MQPHSIVTPLLGGVLIGISSAGLLLVTGKVVGITGIVAGLFRPRAGDLRWRVFFLAGLVLGGFLLSAFQPQAFPKTEGRALSVLALAGLMVGFGARLGGGCTSGHGVCGIGRLSVRSIVATGLFIAWGATAVWLAPRTRTASGRQPHEGPPQAVARTGALEGLVR